MPAEERSLFPIPLRFSAETPRDEIVQSRSCEDASILGDDVEQVSIYCLAQEDHCRTIRSAVFHVKFARRSLSVKARAAGLVEGLQIGCFDYVMLTLQYSCRGTSQMAMIMTVGVGCPFGDELDQAGSSVNVGDRDRIIDRIVELRTAHKTLPVKTV